MPSKHPIELYRKGVVMEELRAFHLMKRIVNKEAVILSVSRNRAGYSLYTRIGVQIRNQLPELPEATSAGEIAVLLY